MSIDAPGAGKILTVLSTSWQLNYNSVVFDQGTFRLRYVGNSLAIVRGSNFLGGSADRHAVMSPAETLSAYEDVANTQIEFFLETDDATTGDSTVELSMLYYITDFSSIT